MSLLVYILGFAIPGTSLMLIRSFAEHKAEREVERRTAVVESRGPLALLFLFNNLHAAHHAQPWIAWYRLPGWYRAHRDELLAGNGGLLYRGYGEVFSRAPACDGTSAASAGGHEQRAPGGRLP
jgi:fatty acid desaturase